MRPPGELAGEPALGTLAERVYAALPAQGREVARQVLLRMVDRAALSRHRRLGEAARLWAAGGRRPEDLLRGTALHEVLSWAPAVPAHLTLNVTEKAFLEASRAQAVRQGRRRRLVISTVAVLLVASLTAGAFAWQQSLKSDESGRQLAAEQARASARRVALQADALRKSDPVMAMLLSVAYSPDGKLFALAHDNRVSLFDVASGRQLGPARPVSAGLNTTEIPR